VKVALPDRVADHVGAATATVDDGFAGELVIAAIDGGVGCYVVASGELAGEVDVDEPVESVLPLVFEVADGVAKDDYVRDEQGRFAPHEGGAATGGDAGESETPRYDKVSELFDLPDTPAVRSFLDDERFDDTGRLIAANTIAGFHAEFPQAFDTLEEMEIVPQLPAEGMTGRYFAGIGRLEMSDPRDWQSGGILGDSNRSFHDTLTHELLHHAHLENREVRERVNERLPAALLDRGLGDAAGAEVYVDLNEMIAVEDELYDLAVIEGDLASDGNISRAVNLALSGASADEIVDEFTMPDGAPVMSRDAAEKLVAAQADADAARDLPVADRIRRVTDKGYGLETDSIEDIIAPAAPTHYARTNVDEFVADAGSPGSAMGKLRPADADPGGLEATRAVREVLAEARSTVLGEDGEPFTKDEWVRDERGRFAEASGASAGDDAEAGPSRPGDGAGRSEAELRAHGDLRGEPMPAGDYPEGDPRNDPGYRDYVAAVDDRIDEVLSTVGDTQSRYLQDDGRYTAERRELHRQIIDGAINDADARAGAGGVPRDRRAITMGGLPGAGKSTYLRESGDGLAGWLQTDASGAPINAVVINPDDVKATLIQAQADGPGLESGLTAGEHAAIVHEESSDVARLLTEECLASGRNVVFDVTLGSSPEKMVRKYSEGGVPGDYGYQVDGAFVDADMATSLHSAGMRHKNVDDDGARQMDGRYVPYDIIEGYRNTGGLTDADGHEARSVNRATFDELAERGMFGGATVRDRETGEERVLQTRDEVGV